MKNKHFREYDCGMIVLKVIFYKLRGVVQKVQDTMLPSVQAVQRRCRGGAVRCRLGADST